MLFTGVHEDARAFASAANDLRAIHAGAVCRSAEQLGVGSGALTRSGRAVPIRRGRRIRAIAGTSCSTKSSTPRRANFARVEPVTTPEFEFIEGPKATRAAFFGLVDWLGGLFGVKTRGGDDFVFDDKAFLALFASLAVDLGIVFLTVVRDAPGRAEAAAGSRRCGAGPAHTAEALNHPRNVVA